MNACATLLIVLFLLLGAASVGVLTQLEGGSEAPMPEPIRDYYFSADTTIIPAGGCVTLSWSYAGATSVYLQPGNGPAGYQEPVDPIGTATVCPSAAINYVPNVPVDYTLWVTFPDGTTTSEVITIRYDNYIGTFTPTPTMVVTPSDDGYFVADVTIIPAGGCVNLAWSKPGASQVYMQSTNWDAGSQQWVDLVGTSTVCPSAALNYVPGEPVTYTLVTTYPDGRITQNAITITYYDSSMTATPTPTPLPPPLSVSPTYTPPPVISSAHYQSFEHGFMLQLSGATCVYAFNTDMAQILMPDPGMGYNFCTPSDGLPDSTITEAPAGLLAPTGIFGRVWANYPLIHDSLGYATDADFYYDGVVPPMENTLGGGPYYMPVISLPNGRQLYCGTRAATSGNCQLR